MIDLDTLAVAAYAVTIAAAIYAEFSKNRRRARRSAFLALTTAILGGVAWVYAVIQRGYVFSPAETVARSRSSGGEASLLWPGSSRSGGGRAVFVDRPGGREPDLEGDGVGEDDSGGASWSGGIITGASGNVGGALSLRSMLSLPASKPAEPSDIDGEVKSECPQMIIIAGGSIMIGAADGCRVGICRAYAWRSANGCLRWRNADSGSNASLTTGRHGTRSIGNDVRLLRSLRADTRPGAALVEHAAAVVRNSRSQGGRHWRGPQLRTTGIPACVAFGHAAPHGRLPCGSRSELSSARLRTC